MYRFVFLFLLVSSLSVVKAQNDLDAMRYSRLGIGGSSRFTAMGGAFGAIGADPSCAAYNPAGLGLIRKGEISFSAGIRITNNTGNIYNTSTSMTDANFTFNNFALAYAWVSKTDPESRNVLSFTNSQLQNFSSSTRMSGYTNSSSIATDMTNLANQAGNVNNLNYSYEGLAYNTYILDNGGPKFISLVDPKRTVLQTRDLVTSGRVNELNFSYAYSYKDKFYFGASLGIPKVQYTSTTTHTESDNKDSMRVQFLDSNNYTSTYVDGLPDLHADYIDKLGFNNLTYTEYFKTQGYGLNLKLGGIARVNDVVRLGAYFHTPTIYYLNDTYYNTMSASFDANPNNPYTDQNPPKSGGYFEYKIITPSRVSVNAAFIIRKLAVIGIDYELVNYKNASLSSSNKSDFAGVNSVIKSKYSQGHNIKVGAEMNVKPLMIRAGYIMQGSPFGDVFSGSFVRQTVSLGVGFRGKGKWYLDITWAESFSKEDYYPFTTINTKATLMYSASTLALTVGIKF